MALPSRASVRPAEDLGADAVALSWTAVEMSPVATAYVGSDGTIHRANYELRGLAGDTAAKLEQRNVIDFMPPEVANRHVQEGLFAKAMEGRVEERPRRRMVCCVGFVRLTGEVVDVRMTIALAPLGLADGLAAVYFEILTDGGREGGR